MLCISLNEWNPSDLFKAWNIDIEKNKNQTNFLNMKDLSMSLQSKYIFVNGMPSIRAHKLVVTTIDFNADKFHCGAHSFKL